MVMFVCMYTCIIGLLVGGMFLAILWRFLVRWRTGVRQYIRVDLGPVEFENSSSIVNDGFIMASSGFSNAASFLKMFLSCHY